MNLNLVLWLGQETSEPLWQHPTHLEKPNGHLLYSFPIWPEISMMFSVLFFVLKIALVIQGRSWFHINFRMFLYISVKNVFVVFLKDFIYSFLFSERGREGEREGEKHQCVVASCVPYWGPGPQPRHVP